MGEFGEFYQLPSRGSEIDTTTIHKSRIENGGPQTHQTHKLTRPRSAHRPCLGPLHLAGPRSVCCASVDAYCSVSSSPPPAQESLGDEPLAFTGSVPARSGPVKAF